MLFARIGSLLPALALCACQSDSEGADQLGALSSADAGDDSADDDIHADDDQAAPDDDVTDDVATDDDATGSGGTGPNGGGGGPNPTQDDDADDVSQPTMDAGEPAPLTDPTKPTDCGVQTLTLARSGTTSSCGFDLPEVEIDTFYLNVYLAPRLLDRRPVCRVGGGGSCVDGRGWFETGGQVALCDETCGQFHDYPEGFLIAEYGCASAFCRDSCGNLSESCAPAQDCCPGLTCEPDTNTCAACIATGDSCDEGSAGLCCSEHCSDGACCYDFGQPCARDTDCCAGACVNAACACAAPEMLCDGACIDVANDSENCGGCGIACGPSATCMAGGCVCDASSAASTYCDGVCVDTQTDAVHCGGCGAPCREDQLCDGGTCACDAGLTECSGACVDTQTSSTHCGVCAGQCSSLQVCEAGACVCRPDRLACGGACIDPMTDNSNCGDCGNTCNGQRRCMAGTCQ